MVKEGYAYGLPLLLVAGGLIGLKVYWVGLIFLVLAIFVLNFFRDPERRIPADPLAIISPADGHIVQIQAEDFTGQPQRRISIFMSPLDVHVNRAPITGTLRDVTYRKGAFHVASKVQASVENEQNVFTIEGAQGTVVVSQIAGAVARRIVFWKKVGDQLTRGERVGMIKFGSRVDILLDSQVELQVKMGDYVQAGSSILGTVKS